MAIRISECSLIITSTTEPKCLVKIVFTSPSVREENTSSVEGDDDKSKPAEGMTSRSSTYFQTKQNTFELFGSCFQ